MYMQEEPDRVNLRNVLREVKSSGLDPREVYSVAVKARPRGFRRAPLYEAVKP